MTASANVTCRRCGHQMPADGGAKACEVCSAKLPAASLRASPILTLMAVSIVIFALVIVLAALGAR